MKKTKLLKRRGNNHQNKMNANLIPPTQPPPLPPKRTVLHRPLTCDGASVSADRLLQLIPLRFVHIADDVHAGNDHLTGRDQRLLNGREQLDVALHLGRRLRAAQVGVG